MRRLIVLVVFSLLASSGPLNAHSPLSSSVPQNGAKLTAYPSDVQLTFKHPVIVTKLTLIHKDGGGVKRTPLPLPSKKMSKTHNVGAAFESDGHYQVEWRALGQDGHVMKGVFSFDVTVSP